jgi:hypothetical protein
MLDQIEFPYLYRWAPKVWGRLRGLDKKGQACRVLVRGGRNSALIEFQDGTQAVVSRNALKRVTALDRLAGGTPR